jgi:catechol 2,3-dioxygenase-like lactoylglutathione lyase family enzyme
MLHHLSIGVREVGHSSSFYDAALAPLGYVRVWESSAAVGYGYSGGEEKFALKLQPHIRDNETTSGLHIAFAAPSRKAVNGFYEAALQHGGRDNGKPEECPEYGEHYYAAFIVDPDGYRIEAVINEPTALVDR